MERSQLLGREIDMRGNMSRDASLIEQADCQLKMADGRGDIVFRKRFQIHHVRLPSEANMTA